MHWIVQLGVLKQVNLDLLIRALERAELPHSIVAIPYGELRLEPEVAPEGPVIVCGAIKMAALARQRGWSPGSFLNDNFDFTRWRETLAGELLNDRAEVVALRDLSLKRDTFVRPVADNKAFDGQVFRAATFEAWKTDNVPLLDLAVLAAPPQQIYREYRLFIIKGQVVTGSQYMRAGKPHLSAELDPEVLAYAQQVTNRWRPAEAFVVDLALTTDGYKIIEFNNINSSGFYNSDVDRYVQAIETAFG